VGDGFALINPLQLRACAEPDCDQLVEVGTLLEHYSSSVNVL
jgi:hypothetical protein